MTNPTGKIPFRQGKSCEHLLFSLKRRPANQNELAQHFASLRTVVSTTVIVATFTKDKGTLWIRTHCSSLVGVSGRAAHQQWFNICVTFVAKHWRLMVNVVDSHGVSSALLFQVSAPCASEHLRILIMSGTLHVGHSVRIISLPDASAASALMWHWINDLDGTERVTCSYKQDVFFRFTGLIVFQKTSSWPLTLFLLSALSDRLTQTHLDTDTHIVTCTFTFPHTSLYQ